MTDAYFWSVLAMLATMGGLIAGFGLYFTDRDQRRAREDEQRRTQAEQR